MKKQFGLWLALTKFIPLFFLLVAPFCIIPVAAQNDTVVTVMQILDAHNAFRTEVGVPALKWSAELAMFAQRWANELANNRDCQLGHRPNEDGDTWKQLYGENIYSGGGSDWAPTILDAVAGWGKEKGDFDFTTKLCKGGGTCGHYTQIIWKNTTHVGCAIAKCGDGNVIVVCNYDPSGNWMGETAF